MVSEGGELAGDVGQSRGIALLGDMQILLGADRDKYNETARVLYGNETVSGGNSWVYLNGGVATKVFKRPDSLEAVSEYVFMRKFGGRAGLPQFIGAVADGYQMERVEGTTLDTILLGMLAGKDRDKPFLGILTLDQGQKILDRLGEYHRLAGFSHTDLLRNVVIGVDGSVRIIDPEIKAVAGLSPIAETDYWYRWLTDSVGIEGLVKPQETIDDETASRNVGLFMQEVRSLVVMDGDRVVKFAK